MQKRVDVIVIGGGPAGLMACAGAAQEGARVLLVEKGEKLGRKLIISGGGRCNVTNNKPVEELVKQIPRNGKFMYSALSRFGSREIIRFFESLGVKLKEEDHGRMFPVSDKAVTVADTLIRYIKGKGVEIRLHSPVRKVLYSGGRAEGVLLGNGEKVLGAAVVVATGGKSVPRTGSTGDGYQWAKEAGHTITPLFPTEVPLTSDEEWIQGRMLQGLSLRDVSLSLFQENGKKITEQRGDMLFTHFGLSGPAALRLGHYVSVTHLQEGKKPLTLRIDLMPDKTEEEVYREVWDMAAAGAKKLLKNALKACLPERMIPLLLGKAGINGDIPCAQFSKKECRELAGIVKGFPMRITGTLSIEEAFVTGGGVSVREIDPKTFASRLVNGLYFAGEILDVNAHTGGYNITIAFSSGFIAGKSAAAHALGANGHRIPRY